MKDRAGYTFPSVTCYPSNAIHEHNNCFQKMFRLQWPVSSILYLSFLFQAFKKPGTCDRKKFKSKVAFNLLFLVSTMSSKSGQIQMTVDANNIQAKSIYHGAKKNKTLFLSLLRLGALKVLDSSASVKSVKLLSSLGGKPCKTTVL